MDFGRQIPVSFRQEAVACCLPAVFNAVLGIVFTIIYARGKAFFLLPAASNIVLGAINLLPVRALDGGRSLWCITASRFSPQAADRLLSITGFILLPVLFFIAVRELLPDGRNFSVAALCFYVILLILGKKT